jgi:hypothetical protein
LRRSFPTPFLIARTITKTRRRIWCVILVPLAIVAGPPVWWTIQLVGLPAVGDPFDVAAFEASTVPDDRNAFVFYDQAAVLFKRATDYFKPSTPRINLRARWSKAAPEFRQWVEQNHEALAAYRQGSERPEALDHAIESRTRDHRTFQTLWSLHLIVLLEASRLEENGDMAGAWAWYRAMRRTIHHVGMRGDVERRRAIQHWHKDLADRVKGWAADPRTTHALVRKALADELACRALVLSERDSLKAAYCSVRWLLDQPTNPGREVPLARFRRFYNRNYTLNPEQIQTIWDWWRYWRREPERSRRVIQLLTANWLAYQNLPAERRPKPDPTVASFDVYALGPESPAAAQALSPRALDRWFDTAYDAQQVLQMLDTSGVRSVERAHDGEILMLLTEELYRRDHGVDPPSPEALVGPYLEKLPDEYRANANDQSQTIPGVRPKM